MCKQAEELALVSSQGLGVVRNFALPVTFGDMGFPAAVRYLELDDVLEEPRRIC